MQASEDMQLLEAYADGRSEEAFATLVSRHINLVYSAALRSVNNPSQAEEIAQAVFVTLARKARGLGRGTVLSGWLYQTARLTASNFIRAETRRQHREQEAYIQSTMNEPAPEDWKHIGPLLDEAMAQLNERDRDAIVLRFFEGKPLKQVGEDIGASEDAAKMRVNRALDKLRDFFHRRGITVPSAALAAAMAEHSIQAAPAGLAATVASAALQGSALTLSSLGLWKGAIQIMSTAKISIAIGVAAAAIITLQQQQVSQQKLRVQQLEVKLAQQAETNRAQLAENAQLAERNASYAKTIEAGARDVAKARAQGVAARDAIKAAAAAPKGNALSEMFKDPAIAEGMRAQMAATMKLQYAPFVKQLNLTPEQADKFYQILTDRSAKSLDILQTGKVSAEDMAASAQSTEADLKSLLGDAGYKQYTDYTQTMGDQATLSLMTKDFADNPLTEAQQQQLLQAVKTARTGLTVNGAQDGSLANPADKMAAMGAALQLQDQINQNVLQQAASFLSPDQLQTLSSSQSNMMAMQRFGMTMAQKMFSNSSSGQ